MLDATIFMFQDWSFKKKGEISNGGMCLTAGTVETHGYVMIHFCTKEDTQVAMVTNPL